MKHPYLRMPKFWAMSAALLHLLICGIGSLIVYGASDGTFDESTGEYVSSAIGILDFPTGILALAILPFDGDHDQLVCFLWLVGSIQWAAIGYVAAKIAKKYWAPPGA